MTVSADVRELVRQNAIGACEYCGITEIDSGGLLTVDHICPVSKGGLDTIDNLVYCCYRCNQYKAAYWSHSPDATELWNPRFEPARHHFLELADGTLHAVTQIGSITIDRLRLNRPELVAHRLRKRLDETPRSCLRQRDALLESIVKKLEEQVTQMHEQRKLMREQNRLLKILRRRKP
jgi:hypothetical protein